MGYSTEFKGELKFTNELTGSQIVYLQSLLDVEPRRDYLEWKAPCSRTDLQFLEDFSGLDWIDTDQGIFYMVNVVNGIIREMRKKYPWFGLTGKFLAQGDTFIDKWELVFEDGFAKRKDIKIEGTIVGCPICGERFVYDEKYIVKTDLKAFRPSS